MLTQGIYAITNTVTGRQYIGSSVNIERRWNEHRSGLRAYVRVCEWHGPPVFEALGYYWDFKRDWLKYGEDAFRLDVLELVGERATLSSAEQRHIDRLRPFYNRLPRAVRTNG